MKFAEFADRAAAIEAEPADLAVVALVRELFCDADGGLPVLARFVQGRVFPAWRSETLDVGPHLCYAAIARAAGPNVSPDDVEERLAESGDVGSVAASYEFGGQRGLAAFGDGGGREDLTVAAVDAELRALATTAGAGSEDRKLNALFGLFNRASPTEARYLARLVLSEMRIGVGEGTVRDAVAEAFDVPVETVARALQVTNDYGRVAELAREAGEAGLDDVGLEVGRPVQAMLAQAGGVTDALDAWGEAAVEVKYDGARVQVHHADGEVSLFSRNMEDVTDALPEVVEFVEARLDGPAILDGEVVAVDEAGDPLPFQEVLRRFRRKHEVDRMREEVALELHAFDCLHAGEDLLDAPLVCRHDRLVELLGEEAHRSGEDEDTEDVEEVERGEDEDPTDVVPGVSRLLRSADPEEIEAFEEAALAAGHEGIMLKRPDAAYTPGDRGKRWLKRKPDVETLDLVVTGAEWGEGRRANHLGTFELSARDEAAEGYVTVGNVATGITDERLAELSALLEPKIRAQDGQAVDLAPSVVFEVGYEEIQRSPTYSSGYALRFPRFVGVRDDKDPEAADTLARLERLADDQ